MSDITERVQRIIEEKLGVDASEVKPEAFSYLQGFESRMEEIQKELEKEFNITIPDDQAEKIVTVGDAISYVEANAK